MKTSNDPRHLTRIQTVKQLFAQTFTQQPDFTGLAKEIYDHREEIDSIIEKAAPDWPIEKLNKVDLSILRLAIFELQHTDVPPKVVIDEAIEIAKEYGSDNSHSFVNGVLGTILKEESIR